MFVFALLILFMIAQAHDIALSNGLIGAMAVYFILCDLMVLSMVNKWIDKH